jgi:HAD superfamily hydrolase (TIGR01662 family)
MPAERPAVFFDRDGTLIHEAHYCAEPSQVRAFDGAPEALVKLSEAGFALVIVTNQSGIGRGYYTWQDAEAVNARMLHLLHGGAAIALGPETAAFK